MPAATSRSAMSLSSTSTLGTKRTPCAWARSASWRAYGAFLSVAVETSEATGMPYDDVYAIATPGRVFDMFTNQAHALRARGPRRPGGSLMLFAGAHAAAALMREPDDVIVERFLADLHALFPATRGVVAGATVHRWELGNVYARPGRGRLQAALEGALGPHENLHLAGDYFAELGNMEAAARTGVTAAERVDARLREVTHV
jgi:protoporphyrinogen/coproporphyrinogen III oxidase